MSNPLLRQAVFISFFGHLVLFSMFSLSFGPKIPSADFSRVCFWGAILRDSDLARTRDTGIEHKAGTFAGKSSISALNKISRQDIPASREYLKPLVSLAFSKEKGTFAYKPLPIALTAVRKEPAIMFYPALPYYFALYFKDRQTVHIELMFQVPTVNRRKPAIVKRRVSSGNLEADLLSMRYISRYLFMQHGGFNPGKWQVVKIDLSTIDD